jgi:hypothetical protein
LGLHFGFVSIRFLSIGVLQAILLQILSVGILFIYCNYEHFRVNLTQFFPRLSADWQVFEGKRS